MQATHGNTLLISEVFPPITGGSGRWFWEIYRRLLSSHIVIAAGYHPVADEFDRSHNLNVHRLSLAMSSRALRSVSGLRGYWRGFRQLLPLVRREQVVRCHAARCLPEGLLALLLKWFTAAPYICYAHGEELGTASTSRELTWLTRRVLRGCDFVIANSHNTRSMLLEEWSLPPERVYVLHPGVDTDRFRPAARDWEMRRHLRWGERPVVLTVGRLQKRKGHDMLIRSLSRLRQVVPNVLYAIVGDGEERIPLEELVEREGLRDHVQFLGELDDERLIACYQQCDLFVLPNRAIGKDIEGFGMVLLEAQACGKPVIAGASGGTAEAMDIPNTGDVVSCEDPYVLADKLGELITNRELLQEMGFAARLWVCEHYDWERLVHQALLYYGLD